jgi:hypothetical protein
MSSVSTSAPGLISSILPTERLAFLVHIPDDAGRDARRAEAAYAFAVCAQIE